GGGPVVVAFGPAHRARLVEQIAEGRGALPVLVLHEADQVRADAPAVVAVVVAHELVGLRVHGLAVDHDLVAVAPADAAPRLVAGRVLPDDHVDAIVPLTFAPVIDAEGGAAGELLIAAARALAGIGRIAHQVDPHRRRVVDLVGGGPQALDRGLVD